MLSFLLSVRSICTRICSPNSFYFSLTNYLTRVQMLTIVFLYLRYRFSFIYSSLLSIVFVTTLFTLPSVSVCLSYTVLQLPIEFILRTCPYQLNSFFQYTFFQLLPYPCVFVIPSLILTPFDPRGHIISSDCMFLTS